MYMYIIGNKFYSILCNDNAIFSDRAIFTFPTVAVSDHVNLSAAKHWRFMPN